MAVPLQRTVCCWATWLSIGGRWVPPTQQPGGSLCWHLCSRAQRDRLRLDPWSHLPSPSLPPCSFQASLKAPLVPRDPHLRHTSQEGGDGEGQVCGRDKTHSALKAWGCGRGGLGASARRLPAAEPAAPDAALDAWNPEGGDGAFQLRHFLLPAPLRSHGAQPGAHSQTARRMLHGVMGPGTAEVGATRALSCPFPPKKLTPESEEGEPSRHVAWEQGAGSPGQHWPRRGAASPPSPSPAQGRCWVGGQGA